MAITFTGLASGINTDQIISELNRFSQNRINSLRIKEQSANVKENLIKSVQSRLQALQSKAETLSRAQGSVFNRRAITSSDESIIKAAAGTGAEPAIQSLRVLSLARAHQVASQGFDDANSQITEGTFEIKAGDSTTATITIDSTNNTLNGLARAINSARIGVTATIINDGSNARTQPYRLLLTSNKTGTDNAITITNNLAADGANAFKPNFASTNISQAVVGASFAGTASVTSNAGAGSYTGTSNDTFTFTVQNGGTVGTDDGIQIAYSNVSGSETGTLTINQSDAGVAKAVVDGVEVTLGSGTLNAGDTFSVDAFVPTLETAQNAQVQLGSGQGAITVASATNQITNLIRGVTLSLQSADPAKEIKLTTTNDVAAAKTEITDFVADYNDLVSFIAEQTKFDSATNTAGPLAGDRSVSELRDLVQRALLSPAADLPPTANRLSVLGITLDEHGKLELNQARLEDALNERLNGVTFSDIKKLFTLRGQSSSEAIEFVTGSRNTKSSSTPYGVDITQAATKAFVTATNALSNSIVIDGTNNQLNLTLDGSAATTVTLTAGTYTPLTLALELQSKINAAVSAQGGNASVSLTGQKLIVTSERYGSASKVNLTSGSALATLGFVGGETSQGQDVAGYFSVDGDVEVANGVGQILTGAATNAHTADLAVQVTLTDSQILGGVDATLSVTHGLASQLNNVLEEMLDPVNGRLKTIFDRLDKNASDAQEATLKAQRELDEQTARLQQQFAAMERSINKFKSQGDFVTNALNPLLASSKK